MTSVHHSGTDTYGVPQVDYDSLPMAMDRKEGWDALRAIGPSC
ncbi:hypothetical protein I553_5198 [Mycobacterium xenopi 4042]|uniref:Uncharacterized protein n=1 Tax=Mycobacterium xenopi 4042 TaxID=1299334 RepID=X7ZXF6_MYCXE|nr:hypothetical protein I553_5198 [Mycobacterium xenopi 4042]